jgi:hypothetical protein
MAMRAVSCIGTRWRHLIIGSSLIIAGCATVPDLGPTTESIPIYKIVERVKCELLDAVKDKLHQASYATLHHQHSPYEFLRNWTAKIDLTLIVNNNSGVSPGVIFTQPLTTESIPLRVTSMARSFSFGLGGGIGTQAFRNETLSFTLSLKEISDEMDTERNARNLIYYNYCELDHGLDLNSNLGLKEWIDSALTPVAPPTSPDYPYLTEGHHPPPGGAAAKASPLQQKSLTEPTVQDVTDLSKKAAEFAQQANQIMTTAVTKAAACVAAVSTPVADAGSQAAIAATAASQAAAQPPNANLMQYFLTAQKAANAAQQDTVSAQTAYNKCVTSIPKDPPIDTISHQVQFIVTWSASASPSWGLLHFKGPGAGTGSLLSASQVDTHTLTITLGAPAAGTTNGSSPDMLLQRQNQNFNATINLLKTPTGN